MPGILRLARLEPAQWLTVFRVHVLTPGDPANQPAVLGSYRVEGAKVRFEPRFPLVAGLRYRTVFDWSAIPGAVRDRKPLTADLMNPKPATKATTIVSRVYPTRATLPANQLKFYVCFSAPMNRGEAYKNVRLLDSTGKSVVLPFLELDQELWDPECRRFTLLFDPDRIERGLQSREEAGPALETGKTYTFEVDRNWSDAEGNPLKETFRKTFRVTVPDDQPIDPKNWKLRVPPATRREPLTVVFPRPFDFALLHRLVWVTDMSGKRVAGEVTLSEEETCWHFTPARPWQPGAYHLMIDQRLEDLAGNQVGKSFEVDAFHPIQRETRSETVQVDFQVR